MKLAVLMLSLLFTLAAHAGTEVSYSYNDVVVVKDSVLFPGYGKISADHVCVSADKQTLHTDIKAGLATRCVESKIDISDSTHPKTVCVKSVTEPVAAVHLAVQVVSMENTCIHWSIDRSDSTHPVKTCLAYGNVQVTQPLSYNVEHYRVDDYRHENPRYTRAQISICK